MGVKAGLRFSVFPPEGAGTLATASARAKSPDLAAISMAAEDCRRRFLGGASVRALRALGGTRRTRAAGALAIQSRIVAVGPLSHASGLRRKLTAASP